MLSSRGTSRNVIPSVQNTPTQLPHFSPFFALFLHCDVIAEKAHKHCMDNALCGINLIKVQCSYRWLCGCCCVTNNSIIVFLGGEEIINV